jgi:predicted ATP-dependent protease
MILSGYLGGKYGQTMPLTLSASITFEQTYEEIDGDSASSTELYAIMSSLAEVPIKQSIAVTGSVNQHGEVQPVGGINRKIEGFFDVCRTKGLTGEQGVMIPDLNIKHLVLRKDVVEAVCNGKFHIYPVKTIDEGIRVLTGVDAGDMKKDYTYPKKSVNGMIMAKLEDMGEEIKKYPPKKKRQSKAKRASKKKKRAPKK